MYSFTHTHIYAHTYIYIHTTYTHTHTYILLFFQDFKFTPADPVSEGNKNSQSVSVAEVYVCMYVCV